VNQNSETPTKKEDTSVYNVPAVDRASRILLMMANESRKMTLAEIAAATGWHKSSVHKILVTLNHHGFLERNDKTKHYSLGISLLRCSQSILSHLHFNHTARSSLKELADYSGETANFAVLRGTKIVIVDVMEAAAELRVSPPVGTLDPVTAKSNGKAILAWLPESQVHGIIQTEGLPSRTKNSITKEKQFLNELAIVRKQGYATDCEEFQEGISAVSAPVFNSEGHVVGTLSIVGLAFRMNQEKIQLYGQKCVEAAGKLSPLIR